jgi:hypothetical protein
MNVPKNLWVFAALAALQSAQAGITTNNLPSSAQLPVSGSTERGFIIRALQGPAEPALANNGVRALRQINGTLVDAAGVAVPNEAIPGTLTSPAGAYLVDTVNFELDGSPVDVTDIEGTLITSFAPSVFPGVPGNGSHTDNFAVEVIGFLKLPAGVTTFGVSVGADRTDVNNDDSYSVFVGTNPRDFFATKVGEFERNSRAFQSKQRNENQFAVNAPVAGVYPFRMIYWQTGLGANLQWYTVNEAGERILVNDPADTRAIASYTGSTSASSSGPYVAEASPGPGSDGLQATAPVTALIQDGTTTVATSGVKLDFNGAAVTPQKLVKTGSRIELQYDPNASRTTANNLVSLLFTDSASTTRTNNWSFGIVTTGGSTTRVAGQWDFDKGDLSATTGKALEYLDGATGLTKTGTAFGLASELGLPALPGGDARVMKVPGDLSNKIGYVMTHGIAPNGGGTRVNQYTIVYDLFVGTAGPGAASLLQTSSSANTDDGDLFWQGNNFGQGGGGYNGRGTFTAGAWHRVVAAYDMAATPPVVTKYVDGIKQDDWTANQGLDAPRRALQVTAVLFGDGDQDERREMFVNSIQVRAGKLSDAECFALGGPSAAGIPANIPASTVTGQWDFEFGDLSASIGAPLDYLDGAEGLTKTGTAFGLASELGVPALPGGDARVMKVPGDLSNKIGYIMTHRINPNGGGSKVNQYTIVYDLFVGTAGPGAASLLQTSSTANTDDGDLFWQGSNFGQGGGGYNGRGTFTAGAWHRVAAAYDMAATPPVVVKYVDGIKQDDWTANQGLDAPRRAMGSSAILFGDGDQDERREMFVSSIQVRAGRLSDAELALLGAPTAAGIPVALPTSTVTGQWDFEFGDLGASIGAPLDYLDGAEGLTKAGTAFGLASELGVPALPGGDARVMKVPGDLSNKIGYLMAHRINPNGGGSKVNQYTIVFDLFVGTAGPGAASLLQTSSTANTDDGDLFWQGNNFGQGGSGYNGRGTFTAGAWHRVAAAYDMAATPPVVVKYVDGIKQDDWTANQGLDAPRRAMGPLAILFGDGDQDERREMFVSSIQVRAGRLSDAQLLLLGAPDASGIPIALPTSTVTGQWDFDFGDLGASIGAPLAYLDGDAGLTKEGTKFGLASELGVDLIGGKDVRVMRVPGDLSNKIGYVMAHRINPNGGGSRVNQYTLAFDLFVGTTGPGAASLWQTSSAANTDDGDLFWQGNNFGQGGNGYNGTGAFTAGAWHRVIAAYDMAATPPVVTKFVDGIKQDDWTANQSLDNTRRTLSTTAILFGDGDQDERREMFVSSVQIRSGKLSDGEMAALGGASPEGLPVLIGAAAPAPTRPVIKLTRNGDGSVTLSWSGSEPYVLESKASLSEAAWSPVSGVANNSITITTSAASAFYRLKQ